MYSLAPIAFVQIVGEGNFLTETDIVPRNGDRDREDRKKYDRVLRNGIRVRGPIR